MNVQILILVLALIGLLTGWLAPLAFHSRRPYGLAGDLLAGLLTMLVFGIPEYLWLLPSLNITGTMGTIIAIGDPFFGVLVVLWVLRKIKPALPAES